MWARNCNAVLKMRSGWSEMDVLLFKGTPESREYCFSISAKFRMFDLTPSLSLLPFPPPPPQSLRIDLERAQTSVWKSVSLAGPQSERKGRDTRIESETISRSSRENQHLVEPIS